MKTKKHNAKNSYGSLCIILHSHLPYVLSHGRWPHGADWLSEASAETYIPILDILNKLVSEKHSPKITIGLTPILAEQLKHNDFKKEFLYYLDEKIKRCKENYIWFLNSKEKDFAELVKLWQKYYEKIKINFQDKYNCDIVGNFKKLQDKGYIEIITSSASHGYLPLLSQDETIQAHIKLGVEVYKKYFGKPPSGIWLPECAYRPSYFWRSPVEIGKKKDVGYYRKGIEEFLSENKIKYFIVDSHLTKGGKAVGVYLDRFKALKELWLQFEKHFKEKEEIEERTPYETYIVASKPENAPVYFFTRDPKTGVQVWSADIGYPGDPFYLDFHKKHFPGGLRLWRVSGPKVDLGDKLIYEIHSAKKRIPEHATHFVSIVKNILKENFEKTKEQTVVCSPYDAELFGHWWYEGVEFLYYVIKIISNDDNISLCTCSEYLEKNLPYKVVSLPEGSWGEGGFHWIWLNDKTRWTWRYIYSSEVKFKKLLKRINWRKNKNSERILKQAARELILLTSSDWQFLISTYNAKDYAEKRFLMHYENFEKLCELVLKNRLNNDDWNFIIDCENQDNVFGEIQLSYFEKNEPQ